MTEAFLVSLMFAYAMFLESETTSGEVTYVINRCKPPQN